MQRLTKYKILMEAIRKHISEESEAEIMDMMVSDRFQEAKVYLKFLILYINRSQTTPHCIHDMFSLSSVCQYVLLGSIEWNRNTFRALINFFRACISIPI
jgi:hypothetical protein